MGQKQSKRISAQSKKNPKRSEEVEVPVEGRESDPERLSAVLQLSEERLDEVKVSLEDMMDESEGSGAELRDINEIQGTIDLILLQNTEVEARMDRKVAALEYRLRELEEAAQAISAEKAKLEQRLAALLETFDKRALVRTEIAKADCELKLAAMSEKVDNLVQEKANDINEIQGTVDLILLENTEVEARMDRKVAALEYRTRELEEAAQAISAEKAKLEQRLAALLETLDKRALERTEIAKADCELKLAAMSEKVDNLVQEKAKDITEIQGTMNLIILQNIEEKAKCEQRLAALLETIDKRALERTEIAKADCELKLAAMSEKVDYLVQEKAKDKAEYEQRLAAMYETIDRQVLERTEEKADCEQLLASISGKMDKLVLERAEDKAEYEQRLAAMYETIDRRVLERTEIQNAECDLKLANISQIIAMLVLEKTEKQLEAMTGLNAGVTDEPIDLSIQATAEERTHMDMKAHPEEKRTTGLVQAAKAISEESTKFREKSAVTPDTTDLQLLTTTQEKMTATSTDPINIAPTAPGSRDPSGVQSNSSESQQPNQDGALTEEGAHEDPHSSHDSLFKSILAQWRDIDNGSLEISSRCLDREQETQTAALDCSPVSQLQEEVTLLLPEQSADPETPAVEERMQTDHDQTVSETSDELSLVPEPCAELEESLKLLNSDERWMKTEGLYLIYQLANHQPETLVPKMEEICRAVLREVLNPLDSVSAVALGTLADLLSLLETYFDPFLDWVGDVLYVKAASGNETLQRLASVALDHMIQSCHPLICMKELLYTLSNPITEDPVQEAVARGCIAEHLLALVESVRYEPEMLELFLSFGHLTQDSSEVVRSCAEEVLAVLSKHAEVHPLPVEAASTETSASPSGPAPSEPKFPSVDLDKEKLQDTLNAILPPRVWSEGDKQWMQQVSSKPVTRAGVIKLQQQLDLQLQQKQARETGICPIRRELYSLCFDELIRQTTIDCAERGLLLARVRDENLMCMAAYQTLFENSVAFGTREVLLSELNKAEMERKTQAKEEYIKELEQKLKDTQAECEGGDEKDGTQVREVEILRRTSQPLTESTEFRENSVAMPDATDLRLLTTTQEKMTTTSTDPINIAPTAPGSRDPSGVQSNSSESQQPNQDGALTEEGAHEDPHSSHDSLFESLWSQWWLIHNRSLEIASRCLDREQETQTAALDCSSVSQLQEEVTLLHPEQSADPETPAVEEKMQTDYDQNVSETSDELSLVPEPWAELEESLKLLNSDERWMKTKGLYVIYQLANHQPETLIPKMEDICSAVLREVQNPLDSVSALALGTLADLLSLLKTNFDLYLDGVSDVLYLKAASDNKTLQRLASVALDHMIQSCSPFICMKELLYTLSNPIIEDPVQDAVARECIAVHLLALVESVRYEPEMLELFLSFDHLTQDSSEVVRSCLEKMLAVLLKHVEVSQLLDQMTLSLESLGLSNLIREFFLATVASMACSLGLRPGICVKL